MAFGRERESEELTKLLQQEVINNLGGEGETILRCVW